MIFPDGPTEWEDKKRIYNKQFWIDVTKTLGHLFIGGVGIAQLASSTPNPYLMAIGFALALLLYLAAHVQIRNL